VNPRGHSRGLNDAQSPIMCGVGRNVIIALIVLNGAAVIMESNRALYGGWLWRYAADCAE